MLALQEVWEYHRATNQDYLELILELEAQVASWNSLLFLAAVVALLATALYLGRR